MPGRFPLPVLDRTQPMLTIVDVGEYNSHGYPVKFLAMHKKPPCLAFRTCRKITLRRASEKPMTSAGGLPDLKKSRP
jgi:hypothetical protein